MTHANAVDHTPERMAESTPLERQQFAEKVCNPRGWGKYDSCKNSPCPYSSHVGCKHPEHPNNTIIKED